MSEPEPVESALAGARESAAAEARREAARLLQRLGEGQSWREAGLLVAAVAGMGVADLLAHPERRLGAEAMARLRGLTARRAGGEPSAYLTGRREFWSLEFLVDRRVLIPRPESEHLVEAVLELGPRGAMRVVDVGTGSGCIGLAIASERPEALVVGVDSSAAALEVAMTNARRLGFAARFLPVTARALSGLGPAASFDIVVSNPPYIASGEWPLLPPEVRDYEPPAALMSGMDGLEVTREVVAGSRCLLRAGGWLVLEVATARAAAVVDSLATREWERTTIRNDLAGRPRVVCAQRANHS